MQVARLWTHRMSWKLQVAMLPVKSPGKPTLTSLFYILEIVPLLFEYHIIVSIWLHLCIWLQKICQDFRNWPPQSHQVCQLTSFATVTLQISFTTIPSLTLPAANPSFAPLLLKVPICQLCCCWNHGNTNTSPIHFNWPLDTN